MITRPPPSSKRFSFTPETAPCTRCDSIIIRNKVRERTLAAADLHGVIE